MKRLKGLYKDSDPIDQPSETYRHAENININKEVGAVVTEEGTVSKYTLADVPIGHTQLPTGGVAIFSESGILTQKDSGNNVTVLADQ
jgi:hypothetical protein